MIYLVGDLWKVRFSSGFTILADDETSAPNFSNGELLLLLEYNPKEEYVRHKFLRLRTQNAGWWHKLMVEDYLVLVKRNVK